MSEELTPPQIRQAARTLVSRAAEMAARSPHWRWTTLNIGFCKELVGLAESKSNSFVMISGLERRYREGIFQTHGMPDLLFLQCLRSLKKETTYGDPFEPYLELLPGWQLVAIHLLIFLTALLAIGECILRRPLIGLLLVSALTAAVALAVIRSRRVRTMAHLHAAGYCPQCAYDLRETPLRCPECGISLATFRRAAGQ